MVLLASSGAGAMESALRSICPEGSRVLVVTGGPFGELWRQLAVSSGLMVDVLSHRFNEPVEVAKIEEQVKKNSYHAVLVLACETGTGVLNSIQSIARVVSGRSLLFVDACSSIGVIDILMDDWGIDVLIGSSQKALMSPPGLSFVALSAQAISSLRKDDIGYLSLKGELDAYAKTGIGRFTPAVSQVCAVHETLQFLLHRNYLLPYQERMKAIGGWMKIMGQHLGLEIFPKVPCSALTVYALNEGMKGIDLRKYLEKRGVFVLGGSDMVGDGIIRIGHMGRICNADLRQFWITLVDVLNSKGLSEDVHKNADFQRDLLEIPEDPWGLWDK